jgi:hypothetical protein
MSKVDIPVNLATYYGANLPQAAEEKLRIECADAVCFTQ